MKFVFSDGAEDHGRYVDFLDKVARTIRSVDAFVESRAPAFPGVCGPCRMPTSISVKPNAHFGQMMNLRETCECECGLIQRTRALLQCVLEEVHEPGPVAVFEHGTLFNRKLADKREIVTCAYGGARYRSGETVRLGGGEVQHQDMTGLSFASDAFAAVVHNDVLEHIPDYRMALQECHRVLRPGGSMVFTCPAFLYQRTTAVRARIENGSIVHILPPEVHGVGGDPDFPEGFLAYYNFGWDLVTTLREIFAQVEIYVFSDPLLGYTSNNHPVINGGNMLATIFVCRKSASA